MSIVRGYRSVGREWQRGGTAEIGRRVPRQLVDREVILGHALEEALHRNFGDQPRHLAAQAKMLAGAEAKMPLRPPLDVVDVGILEFPPVAVARAEGERDLVAHGKLLAVQLDLAHDSALETLRRGVEAQRLLDRRRDQRR